MLKSPNDRKNYQNIILDNGLRVLLVENFDTTKSAAALAVNAGHFNDPQDRQGLAHFLEHMLFLGTEKYPDGSEYQKFISRFGGTHNAWTGTEHTCYFFDIYHQHFNEALDRFSEFFKSPLLSEEFVIKERQNIDAEFKLKLKDDMRRLYDVHKETINPAHPFAQFSVGNNETLADRDGVSVSEEIAKFFNQYYRAAYMTLVLEGPHSLSVLADLANNHFSGIAKSEQPIAKITEPLYLPEHQQVVIHVKPVKNDRQLLLSFAMPSIDHLYRHKPESVLAYLLGHEGPGSILSYLKKQQWAFRLTAGSGINGSNFKDFNITIALTELGETHINEIIACVYAYIDLLKAQPLAEFYYEEKKAIAMFSFQYQEKMKALDSVSHLAITMQHYAPEDYIFGDYVMDKMCHDSINYLLNFLTVQNSRVIIISENGTFDKTSRWYQVPYHLAAMNNQQLTMWQNPVQLSELALPLKNEFIVDQPQLVAQESDAEIPQVIMQSSGFVSWFKQDQCFNVPKGYIYLSIDCPNAIKNTQTLAMTRLFVELYSDNVVEENYNAELAGIHYHLYPHQGGMTLQLSGISEKQPLLLTKLLSALQSQKFNQDKFNLFKKQIVNHWRDADKSKSISQLFNMLSSSLQPKKPCNDLLANCLEKVTFSEFIAFYQNLFNHLYLELLIHGNWQKADALRMSELIKITFAEQINHQHKVNIEALDNQNVGEIILPLILPEHDHAAVVYYPMPDKNIKTMALTMVLSQLLSPHFFHEMRTEKQFGYLVGVGYIPVGFYPGLAMYIQSPESTADTLVTAIDEFTQNALAIIEQLSEQNWHQLQESLTSQLLENDVSLRIKSQRFWSSLANQDYEFNRKQKLIAAINQITLADVSEFLTQYFIATEQQDRLVLISLKNEEQLTNIKANKKIIKEIGEIEKICKIKL